MPKTTYARGEDPRNMTRPTLARHLRTHVTSTPESKTLKRRVFDDWTTGWKIHWTNSRNFDTFITWENGSTNRSRSAAERDQMRETALAEIDTALTALGYVTKRTSNHLLVLRRMGA